MLVATVFWGIIKGALQGLGFGMAFWMILHGSALASFIGTVHNVIATVIYGFAAVESFSRGNNAQGIIRGIIASITGLASAIGILRGCGLLELSNCTSAENIHSLAQSGLDALNDNQGCVGSDGNTATVWDNINATQNNYSNTNIPRSFEVDVNGQTMWVHGNATEHIYEDVYAHIIEGEGTAYTNPNLYTQELMNDFYNSLEQATASGIEYGKLITAGNWKFIFSPPRQEGLLPVIIHAQFNGW